MLRSRALRRALFGVVSAELASLASAEARLVCAGVGRPNLPHSCPPRRAPSVLVWAELASLVSAEARPVCAGLGQTCLAGARRHALHEAWKALFTRVASPCKSDASPLGMTRTRMLFDAQRMRTASARWALNALAQNGLASLLRHAPPAGPSRQEQRGAVVDGADAAVQSVGGQYFARRTARGFLRASHRCVGE